MLEMCFKNRPTARRIIEIGSGSGFHLACARELFPSAELIGYEAELESIRFAKRIIGDYNINFIHSSSVSGDIEADIVFCTFLVSGEMKRSLFHYFPNAIKIFPSLIEESEYFQSANAYGQLLRFESYDDYLAHGESFQKIGVYEAQGDCLDKIFDVRFVQQLQGIVERSEWPSEKSALERFMEGLCCKKSV